MVLHKRYDPIRTLVDRRFRSYRRRCVRDGIAMERIEMWHDLLQAALQADREFDPSGGTEWEEHILKAVEEVYAGLLRDSSCFPRY